MLSYPLAHERHLQARVPSVAGSETPFAIFELHVNVQSALTVPTVDKLSVVGSTHPKVQPCPDFMALYVVSDLSDASLHVKSLQPPATVGDVSSTVPDANVGFTHPRTHVRPTAVDV
jgi:hypothetical protein